MSTSVEGNVIGCSIIEHYACALSKAVLEGDAVAVVEVLLGKIHYEG
jgi:hypothetical protein